MGLPWLSIRSLAKLPWLTASIARAGAATGICHGLRCVQRFLRANAGLPAHPHSPFVQGHPLPAAPAGDFECSPGFSLVPLPLVLLFLSCVVALVVPRLQFCALCSALNVAAGFDEPGDAVLQGLNAPCKWLEVNRAWLALPCLNWPGLALLAWLAWPCWA